MPKELEIWLLFGYFVCVMFQTNKQNGVDLLYRGIIWSFQNVAGTSQTTVKDFPIRLKIIHILLIRAYLWLPTSKRALSMATIYGNYISPTNLELYRMSKFFCLRFVSDFSKLLWYSIVYQNKGTVYCRNIRWLRACRSCRSKLYDRKLSWKVKK